MKAQDAMRLVIIANGDCPDTDLKDLGREGDWVLCLNGGSNKAVTAGIIPNVLIGDLDSLSAETARFVTSRGVEVLRYPARKNQTDMELGLEYLRETAGSSPEWPRNVLILGALGERIDQTLANIFLLERYARQGFRFRLPGYGVEVLVCCGPFSVSLTGSVGLGLSLLPLSCIVEGISLEGLKYPVKGMTLRFGDTRGVSNEFTGCAAKVSFLSGVLLIAMDRPVSGTSNACHA